MGSVTIRTGITSRGMSALSPWIGSSLTYSVMLLLQGTNPISLLEIVSALNFFNLTEDTLQYNAGNRLNKYNLKVFFGTIQSVGKDWNYDNDTARQNLAQGGQKSGS